MICNDSDSDYFGTIRIRCFIRALVVSKHFGFSTSYESLICGWLCASVQPATAVIYDCLVAIRLLRLTYWYSETLWTACEK